MRNKIVKELKRIAKENAGVLQPENVVESARPITSPLHSRFEWDDSIAGERYRIWQARQLIKVVIEVMPQTNKETQVFISLKSDRYENGGYRVITEVLSDVQLRAQMLHDALDELECFRDKYKTLKELAEVFSAIKRARKKRHGRKGTARRGIAEF